jgi:hypothetical protein
MQANRTIMATQVMEISPEISQEDFRRPILSLFWKILTD